MAHICLLLMHVPYNQFPKPRLSVQINSHCYYMTNHLSRTIIFAAREIFFHRKKDIYFIANKCNGIDGLHEQDQGKA